MSFVGNFFRNIFGSGDDNIYDASITEAEALIRGAEISAESQREALEYLKEKEAIPKEVSEAALKNLGGLYGLPGGTGSQQELVNRAISSPLYKAIMSGQEVGEEAILANAAMTGGFRSGNVQGNLYDYNTRLQNKALLDSYNQQLQGLTGLAGLPSNASEIAQVTAGIGQTLGQGQATAGNILSQGQIAAAQAEQARYQQGFGNLMGLGTLALAMFSDRRLKKNLEKIGEVNGHNWYVWDWDIVANKMGLEGKSEGVLADELVKTNPECIGIKDGFMFVDYCKLGIFPKEACVNAKAHARKS